MNKIHNLWPTPIYQSLISVNKKDLEYVKNLDYIRMNSNHGYITKNKYVLSDINLLSLKNNIENHLKIYVYETLNVKKNIQFYFLNSWVNNHKPKDYSEIHNHSGSLISGVYYFNIEPKIGNISFHQNLNYSNVFHSNISFPYEKFDNINARFYSLGLSEGTILFFPSHIEHNVEQNLSNSNRYSLAFNIFAKGEFKIDEDFTLCLN
jgi:uncharacterized protein (TIGR02466 family)